MLSDQQVERLTDIIGDASACNDGDCGCHRQASLAKSILDGEENYEVIDDV